MTTGPINPHDAVNRLFNQGAKKVASTFGAMSKKTDDKQKLEKQNYDINKEYQVVDQRQTTKELEKNAKDTGLINQSLTNKELEKEDELQNDYELFVPSKEVGVYKGDIKEEEEISGVSLDTSRSVVDKEDKIFEELARNVGVSAREIKEAAKSEVIHNLETNRKEMSEIKVTNDTNYLETNIIKEEKPATSEIKEGKLIIMKPEPIPVEQANELF
jgi:hypothetical protein